MNWDAVPGKNDSHFLFSTKHHGSVCSCTALWSNMGLMEPKHTWLLTNLKLLLYHVPWLSYKCFPQSQIVMLHTIRLQKKHHIKLKCVSTLSFSVALLHWLVSWTNLQNQKSIILLLWALCTSAALKVLFLASFFVSTLLYLVLERSSDSVVRILKVC